MSSDRAIRPLSLEGLFGPDGIAVDENGDAHPDRLKVCIGVESGLSDAGLWAQILNLAARLAAEVTALDPPVVKSLRRVAAGEAALLVHRPAKRHPWAVEFRRSGRTVHLAGRSAARMAEGLFTLAVNSGRPRTPQGPWSSLRAADGETRVVEAFDRRGRSAGRFRLLEACPAAEAPGVERFDLMDPAGALYRTPTENPRTKELALTIEIPGPKLSGPVGFALSEAVVAAVLEATAVELPLAVSGAARAGGVVLRVSERPGRGARLAVEPGTKTSTVVVRAEGDARSLAGLIQAYTVIGFSAGGPAGEGVQRLRGRVASVLAMIDAGVAPASRSAPAPAPLRRRLTWRSESERLMAIVRRVPPGRGPLQGVALLSKPGKARAQARREIAAILRAKGYAPEIVVLNAYKPGLSWLREVVQPALEAAPRVAAVRVDFREFAPGEQDLEMRSRWLQELFPGPDLLAAALGLPPARVRLSMRRRLAEAYVVTAWDREGARVYRAGFTPRVSRLPYLPGLPASGRVNPCTAGIRLARPGGVLLDESFPTDRERFWRFFQERILPALEEAMSGRVAEAGGGGPAAFWEEAAIDVRIPESDERLGLGEERVAPLEALHEDLYFVLLEHFRLFAEKHGLPAESQFGRILPRVSTAAPAGRPQALFRARPFRRAWASDVAAPAAAARVAAVGWEAGRLEFEIEAGEPSTAKGPAHELCRRARARGLELTTGGRPSRFIFRAKRFRPPAAHAPAEAGNDMRSAPPLDRFLPRKEVGDWVRRLGRRPHLRAWQAGSSWQGRPIWALEAVLAGGGGLVSIARARLLKPTLLMNARHHANEVSSTNAALRLAWELAATARGRKALRRVNVAILPLENADGVATLEELLPGCEDHKLHAARYNALGVEWYADYFREPPRFPEARVKPLLWRRWLPLLVLDAHGVPSHEWDQPFSGYAPGRFRQYWIPRAFIYAIMPFIDEPSHPGHGPAREIAGAMDRALRADRGIQKLDRELKQRYVRYARAWEPGTFPPTGGRGLAVLPSERRLAGLNFGVQRFPVTVSEIVTEVTDEVVSGRLLALCAQAHLTAARALLKWLGRRAGGRVIRRALPGGGLRLSWEPADITRAKKQVQR